MINYNNPIIIEHSSRTRYNRPSCSSFVMDGLFNFMEYQLNLYGFTVIQAPGKINTNKIFLSDYRSLIMNAIKIL
jgi:hypothetical protein